MERVALPLAKISGLTAKSLLFSAVRNKPQFWQEFVHDPHAGVKLRGNLSGFLGALLAVSGSICRGTFKGKVALRGNFIQNCFCWLIVIPG